MKVRLLYLAFITVVGESMLIRSIWDNPLMSKALTVRIVHLLIGVLVCIYLLMRTKVSRPVGLGLYCLFFLPLVFPLYFTQVALIESGAQNLSFIPVHVLLFSVAIFYSGSLLLNASFLTLFTGEMIYLYSKYTTYYESREPYVTLIVSLICYCMLVFRDQDERTYRKYLHEKYRSDVLHKLAHMILSLRDKSNSPIQSLYLFSEMLKSKKTLNDDMIQSFQNSVIQLKEASDLLHKLQSKISFERNNQLMTFEEIEIWINELESNEGHHE